MSCVCFQCDLESVLLCSHVERQDKAFVLTGECDSLRYLAFKIKDSTVPF